MAKPSGVGFHGKDSGASPPERLRRSTSPLEGEVEAPLPARVLLARRLPNFARIYCTAEAACKSM